MEELGHLTIAQIHSLKVRPYPFSQTSPWCITGLRIVHELSALRVLPQLWCNQLSHANLCSDSSIVKASPRVARSTTVASWKFTVGTLLPVLVADPSRAHAIAGIGGL